MVPSERRSNKREKEQHMPKAAEGQLASMWMGTRNTIYSRLEHTSEWANVLWKDVDPKLSGLGYIDQKHHICTFRGSLFGAGTMKETLISFLVHKKELPHHLKLVLLCKHDSRAGYLHWWKSSVSKTMNIFKFIVSLGSKKGLFRAAFKCMTMTFWNVVPSVQAQCSTEYLNGIETSYPLFCLFHLLFSILSWSLPFVSVGSQKLCDILSLD